MSHPSRAKSIKPVNQDSDSKNLPGRREEAAGVQEPAVGKARGARRVHAGRRSREGDLPPNTLGRKHLLGFRRTMMTSRAAKNFAGPPFLEAPTRRSAAPSPT
ncbi:hypothetical protein PCANC_27312 [Puccinia coronata f. sp. avenae]|uniref:Uncharacterized protein n=1 Tax=Puccinia coronata f. sp. avenae TaxID=200324 RepID=A0A2N5TGM6_9BASI|nr:hypothetical protein PCANC_27312 [Puccinia coronata f. sp. avenae]